jgi:hypothetical protein
MDAGVKHFTVTVVRLEHPKKALSPIEFTLSGIVTDVRLLQFIKAKVPIEVNEEGKFTEINFSHPLNVFSPKVSTPSGMVTDFNPLH